MQSHAADRAKAAVADLMSIAKWKVPHASAVAWQAGLDEINRFYRSDVSHSTTGPQPTEGYDGRSHEYNAQQAGSTSPQSLFSPAHEKLLSFSPEKVPRPVDFELTVKQNGALVLQQEQAAESLLQPDPSVPKPANKLHPPHASSSFDPEKKTSLPELKQNSQSIDVETSPDPLQTQHQPPSDAIESDRLQPPTQQAKKTPLSRSQSSLPQSQSVQRDSSTPLLPKTHEWPPLQQNSQWNSVGDIVASPKWTLEPPPPPGLQPAFEREGKNLNLGANIEGSRLSIPCREKREKGGSPTGGASVSRDEVVEGNERRKEGFSVENEGRGGDGAVEERRLGELRANVMERDQGADLTACQKEKFDGAKVDREDGTRDSDPDGNTSTISHTSAPDTVVTNDQNVHEKSNEQTNKTQRNDNKTTLRSPSDQPTPAAEPHINPNTLPTNPLRWSPTNSRTFSNARDEIARLKRGRENSSSTRSSSSSNPAHSASSPLPPPAKKTKKKARNEQTASSSHAGEQASEQSPPEVTLPEGRNTDSENAPTPADEESPVNTAESDPPALDLPSTQPNPSSPAKENQNQTHETKKRKRSPRRAMSKRELTNLEGTTVEGKLRRRGIQERQGQEQPESRIPQQGQQPQKQKKQQVQKERKRQKGGQEEEEGRGKGIGKGEQNEGKQGKGKESTANGDGASRRKRQRRS